MTRHALVRLVSVLLLAAAGGACVQIHPSGSHRSRYVSLDTLVEPDRFWTQDKVLLIGISGVLSAKPETGGLLSSPSTLVQLKDDLKRAEEDASIRAVLLRIDTPGGSVTASDLMYHEVMRFKEKTGKKVVAVCMGVAASGGYYLAMAADAIYLHPTSITGSIGVIGMFPDISGLSNKIGFGMRVVKSGDYKDMGSPWRAFTSAERDMLQESIDAMYERFLEIIAQGRPKLKPEEIRKLADGRVYDAEEAVKLGLADAIGYMDDAFAATKKAAGLRDAALVGYTSSGNYRGHYYASAPSADDRSQLGGFAAPSEINLLNINLGSHLGLLDGEPFHYLWLP